MILNESDGVFSYKEWNEACEVAEEWCCREEQSGGVTLHEGMEMENCYLREPMN